MTIANTNNELNALTQNALFRELENVSKMGGWQYDVKNESLFWSQGVYEIYGLSTEDQIDVERAISFYKQSDRELISSLFEEAITHKKSYIGEFGFRDAKGIHKWIRTTGNVICDGEIVTHVYGVLEDISDEKRLVENNKNHQAILKAIVDNLNDVVILINRKGKIKGVNKAIREMFGYSNAELLGEDISLLMPSPYSDKHSAYLEKYLETGAANIIGVGRELPAKKKDGSVFPMELSISEVILENKPAFIGVIRDITYRKKAEKEIYHLAYFDKLTNIPNRSSLERDFQNLRYQARLTSENIWIAHMDIDRFSQVNLAFGCKVGDSVLSKVSSRISHCLDTRYTVYRSSADTFIILYNSPVRQTHEFHTSSTNFLDTIKQAVAQDLNVGKKTLNITLSSSSLFCPQSEANLEKVLSVLKLGATKAKSAGGNNLVAIDEFEFRHFERKSNIENNLLPALEREEYFVVFQPQFNSQREVIAAEVLLRWESSELGFVGPDEFIPLAEDTGAIIKIGKWVFEQACQTMKNLIEEGFNISFSVNLSAKQVVQTDLADFLIETCSAFSLNPSNFVLEITETTLVTDFELVKTCLKRLTDQGFELSIDDFGTGYSSLSYLKEFHFHELKIDKSFVDEIGRNEEKSPITKSLIYMTKTLNGRIVAEGVEYDSQFNYLKECGCDIYQGFLLSKPLVEHDLIRFLKSQI
jgi:PAS domain S-box-containing protein/diguanylate cyclase (GGDEF)-like protein